MLLTIEPLLAHTNAAFGVVDTPKALLLRDTERVVCVSTVKAVASRVYTFGIKELFQVVSVHEIGGRDLATLREHYLQT